jgi:translation elongation factor EF-G
VAAERLKDDLEVTCSANQGKSTSGLVFKIIYNPYAGKLNLFGLFLGFLKRYPTIYNFIHDASERVRQLYIL